MLPIAVIEPSTLWHRRAAIFAFAFLALIVVGGYLFHPIVLLLAPIALYRGLHALRFLQPGRVGIRIYEDHLVCQPAFGKCREVKKADVFRFLSVYHGTTEVVVARIEDVTIKGTQSRQLKAPSDIIMPSGLMRNPGLVRRLEAWRTDQFTTDSLIPLPAER